MVQSLGFIFKCKGFSAGMGDDAFLCWKDCFDYYVVDLLERERVGG